MREDRVNLFSKIMTILAYTFILAPMIIIVVVSFNSGEAISFPPSGFSLRWYENIFTGHTDFLTGFINSIKIAVVATAIDIFIGVFASLCVSRAGDFSLLSLQAPCSYLQYHLPLCL